MKITVVSDLHLEFGYQELPGGEVLILAGDIAEARSIHKDHHSTKLASTQPSLYHACSEFFKFECAKYDQVFYIMGNHEHYHGRFDQTYEVLKNLMPGNVTLLEREVCEYNGVMFMGGSLWTDCNKNDPLTFHTLKYSMNDYRVVKNKYSDTVYHKLSPEHTAGVHRKTVEYFKFILSENRGKKFVVATHHGPSWSSVHPKYAHDRHMNGGYVSDLSEMILDNPEIAVWVHGHLHDPVDYMIGSTRVLSNPRGYQGHEDTSQFNPNLVFEV